MRSTVFGSNSTFQPVGPEPDSSICSATAVPELISRIGMRASLPAVALPLRIPSRPAMSIFGWPVTSITRSEVTVASSAMALATTLYLSALTVFGGRILSLTSFSCPASAGRGFLRDVETKLQRDLVVGRRHHRSDGLAVADQSRGPALRRAGDRQFEALGRQRVILQAQVDGRGCSGPHADGRIVGQQEQP